MAETREEEIKRLRKAIIQRHRKTLNKLESHLGCVQCHGPLVDGFCAPCEAREKAFQEDSYG